MKHIEVINKQLDIIRETRKQNKKLIDFIFNESENLDEVGMSEEANRFREFVKKVKENEL